MGSFYSASRNAAVKNKARVQLKDPVTNKLQERHIVAKNADETFIDLLERVPRYKDLIDVSCKYDVYISRGKLHWFLIVKNSCSRLPYLTIEISRGNDKVSFLAMMDTLEDVSDKELLKEGECISLRGLCDIADSVKRKMGQYSLFDNNCQHFCNNMLKWLDYEQFPTTTKMLYNETTLEYDVLGFDAWPAIEKNRAERMQGQS